MKQNETTHNMMRSGCKPQRDKEAKVKIALFSPLVNPKEIAVPHIMKGRRSKLYQGHERKIHETNN